MVQGGLFAVLACFAAMRVRTPAGAAQLAALTYLLMLLTGPQSGSHIFSVVVPLVIIAEAARQGRGAAGRARVPAPTESAAMWSSVPLADIRCELDWPPVLRRPELRAGDHVLNGAPVRRHKRLQKSR